MRAWIGFAMTASIFVALFVLGVIFHWIDKNSLGIFTDDLYPFMDQNSC